MKIALCLFTALAVGSGRTYPRANGLVVLLTDYSERGSKGE